MTTGWQNFSRAIETAQADLAAAAVDEATAAEGRGYIVRFAAAMLASDLAGHLLTDNGLMRCLPAYGGFNPDYRMLRGSLDPGGCYRISGQLNGSERVGIGVYRIDNSGVILPTGYAAFDQANSGSDGSFSLEMAADLTTGPGALQLHPESRVLVVRILHRDPDAPAAILAMTSDRPTAGLTLSDLDDVLGAKADWLVRTIRQFLEWTRLVSQKPNVLDLPPPELAAAVQGDRDTVYLMGYYALAENEWLEIEVPSGLTGYWGIHAHNHWFENLLTEGAHDRNTVADSDGRIRVRIGPNVPTGLPNRLDTAGRRRGAIMGRLIGSSVTQGLPARIVTA